MSYPIARFLNVRQSYAPTFSADGRRIAFIGNITGTPQLWQVEYVPGSDAILWPEQLTFEHDRVLSARFSPVAGDGRLVFSSDSGGDEKAQLYLLSGDGAVETPLTKGHEAAMHLPGIWSPHGRYFAFAANRRHPGLFDLYLLDLEAPGEARRLWTSDRPGYLWSICFSPGGRRLAFTRNASSSAADLFLLELGSGAVRQLNDPARPARYEDLAYAADRDALYLLTDLDSDFMGVARLDLESGRLMPVARHDWDCEHLTASPDGRALAYVVNAGGASKLLLLDLTTGLTRQAPLPESAPGVIGVLEDGPSFSGDGNALAFSFTSAIQTADIFVWNLLADRARPVTASSYGGLPPSAFVAPELIHYPTFDGREIPAWFYRPQNAAGPAPVVVLVHGGPESQMKALFHFLVQFLVNNGYAVLAPNVRGSTGYGKAYSHLDDVEKRMDSVADLAHAAYWLKDRPEVDGERIAVYGGSYGGFMVLAALTYYPDLWAAGVELVGIGNFVTFLENTSEYRRAHREAEYGSLARDREFLERIAPINHLDAIRAPLMIIHGANDPRVPVSEAHQVAAALRARDIPVETLIFDDEGHGLIKLKNKLVAYPAVVAFLNRHLRP
jgi:dipeptidyl aminopeptidase/acylaminoacyl peptidase